MNLKKLPSVSADVPENEYVNLKKLPSVSAEVPPPLSPRTSSAKNVSSADSCNLIPKFYNINYGTAHF